MDEQTPENGSTNNEEMDEGLASLLREFLENEIRELRLQQKSRELDLEEEVMHDEQYEGDSEVAHYDYLFALENC